MRRTTKPAIAHLPRLPRTPKRRLLAVPHTPEPENADPLKPVTFLPPDSQRGKRHLVDFQFYAPGAGNVTVVLGRPGSLPRHFSLKDLGGGAWSLRLLLSEGHYEYHFLVDGQWRPDPLAPHFLEHSGERKTQLTLQ